MSTINPNQPANDPTPNFPLVNAAWENFWGLGLDAQKELFKQSASAIAFLDSALHGATELVAKANDRANLLTKEALLAADRSGRKLALLGYESGQKLIAQGRNSAAQLVANTRNSARNVADRAGESTGSIVAPPEKAA